MTQATSDVITCSGCGKTYHRKPEWAGRTVKCKCGAVLVSAVTAPPAMAAAMGGIRRSPAREEATSNNVMKFAIPGGIALVLVIAAVIGFKMLSGEDASAPSTLKGHDVEVVAWMKKDGYTEAREWLGANKQRMIAGWTNQKSSKHTDEFYDMGAKRVIVRGQGIMTHELALELPEDPAQREKIFAWANRWATEHHEKAVADEGQQWVRVIVPMSGL